MERFENKLDTNDVKYDYRAEGENLLEAYAWFKDEAVLQSFTGICERLIDNGDFGNKKHLEIIGVGSGAGLLESRVNRVLRGRGFATRLYMSDIIPENVEQGRMQHNEPDVYYLQMDGKELSLVDNTMDLAMARSVHHYEPTPELEEKIISEIKRVLKPGGFFIDQTPTFKSVEEADLLLRIHALLPKKISAHSKESTHNMLNKFFDVQEVPSELQAKKLVTPKDAFLKRYNITDPNEIEILSKVIVAHILDVPEEDRPNVWCDAKSLDFGWTVDMTMFVCRKRGMQHSKNPLFEEGIPAENASMEVYQSFMGKHGEKRTSDYNFIKNLSELWSEEIVKERRLSDIRINSHMIFPAHKQAHYEKILNLEGIGKPDVVLIDLEDAVADAQKPQARETMRSFLVDSNYSDRVKEKYLIGARINNYRGEEYKKDIEAIDGLDLDFLVLPKVESADEIHQIKKDAKVNNLMVAIETLIGHDKRREIISAMGKNDVLIVGYEDLCGDLNIPRQPLYDSSNILRRYLEDIIMEAKLHNITLIDAVTRGYEGDGINDLNKESQLTATWGLPAKMCINPKQVAIVNRTYLKYKVARLNEITKVLEQTQAMGQNALGSGGELVSTRSILKPMQEFEGIVFPAK